MNDCPLPIHHVELSNTLGYQRSTKGVVYPESVSDIQRIIFWATKSCTSLYTVSAGRNWGYGSSSPILNDNLILNLSRMNKIESFDTKQGTVVLEPGVTQGQLYDFLQEHGLSYLTPITGAGPSASILGNALEKGYGITPYQDHMGSVMNIEAILADGTVYSSALKGFGGHRSDDVFPWKIGPYLEGLFFQSNFGIVTRATIALARKPQSIRQFILFIPEEGLEKAIEVMSDVRRTYGSLVGGINLMNKRRVLSMIPADEFAKIERNLAIADWTAMGGLYGPDRVLSALQKELKALFRPFSGKVVFLTQAKLDLAEKFLDIVPASSLKGMVGKARQAFDVLSGIPSEVALPLAYLKNDPLKIPQKNYDPDRDNCGLMWFAPLLPNDPALVRTFYQEAQRICHSYRIDPLVTFTSISERCFDATIPILFNQKEIQEKERAYKCYESLMEMCVKIGIFPYRLDIMHIPDFFNREDVMAVNLYAKIKNVFDPHGILSPGRYAKS